MTTTNTELSPKTSKAEMIMATPKDVAIIPTDWGTSQITTDECDVTRVKLMQSTSDAVKKEINKSGELVNKTTGLVVGGRGTPIEVIIFSKARYWIVYEKDSSGKSAFKEVLQMTPANSSLPRVEGMLKRVPVWEYYCLQAGDYKAMPWVVSFTGASFKHGKKLNSTIKNTKVSMGSYTYLLDTVTEVWDGNSYYVYNFKQGKKTTSEQEAEAYRWFKDSEKAREAALRTSDDDDDDDDVTF